MRLALTLVTTVVLGGVAGAHLVPLNPSNCGLTMALAAPSLGMTATVDAPGADQIRTVYSANGNPTESHMQVCAADPSDPAGRCGAVVPRGLTMGALSGTIALPALFNLQLLSSGDLRGDAIPVTLTLGATPTAVPFALATGFVAVGDTLLLGSAVDANGAFTLVGTGTSATLPAPLGGADLVLTLSCALAPPPDLDQFALAPRVTKVAGTSTQKKTTLALLLQTSAAYPGSFSGAPLFLRVGPADAPIVHIDLPGGLQASGRRFVATLNPGTATVSQLHRRTGLAYRVQVKGVSGLAAAASSGASELAIETGGLFARQAIALKANGAGTRLKVRMP